jgi:hypothetical protein|tara:strand:- start:34 stop:237 length:204 start_codon:yes stop_codon:yes gene_type:complete
MSKKNNNNKDITRKDAIKKMGSYAAFAALGTIIMLNPQKAQAQSGIDPPGFDKDFDIWKVRKVKSKK